MLTEIDKDFYCSCDYMQMGNYEPEHCHGKTQDYCEGCSARHRKYLTPEQFKNEYGEEWTGAVYYRESKYEKRFSAYSWQTELIGYILNEPAQIKKPQNIFVCSMADLFGDWVPDEWIEKVFEACKEAPQHRYLFLTKNPKRYEQFIDEPMSSNMWFGFSQTKNEYIGFDTHPSWNVFVSIEPLLCDLNEKASPEGIDWVIIGRETGNRKNKIIPKKEWIENIVAQCRGMNVPVFMKNNLKDIWQEQLIQEFPWDKEKE